MYLEQLARWWATVSDRYVVAFIAVAAVEVRHCTGSFAVTSLEQCSAGPGGMPLCSSLGHEVRLPGSQSSLFLGGDPRAAGKELLDCKGLGCS